MKKLLTIIALLSIMCQTVNAQKESWEHPLPRAYIGFGTGINSFTGILGAAGNVRLGRQTFLEAGVGLGGWGYKYSIGFRYDFGLRNTFGLGVNYTGATGVRGVSFPMTLTNGVSKNVTIDCNQAATIDLKGRYSMKMGRKNIFYIDLGYALPLEERAWEVADGSDISWSDKEGLDITQPGGMLLELGLLFGLR